MTSQSLDHRLLQAPWGAVVGELVTAACFGLLSLFLPLGHWVKWPELLFNWHFGVAVIGALALARALVRRKPHALKTAVAAHGGAPFSDFILLASAPKNNGK